MRGKAFHLLLALSGGRVFEVRGSRIWGTISLLESQNRLVRYFLRVLDTQCSALRDTCGNKSLSKP